MALLDVAGLRVSYGDAAVLWDISFQVNAGEVVALVGANGAGKTTTLLTISGILSPSSGTITLDGQAIHGRAPHEVVARGVAHVPEGRRLFPDMSVEENLLLGALALRPKALRASRLQEAYALFPRLKERRLQVAGTLSGGEQQMAAIARGLMSKPRLIMLDEPSLGLSPILQDEIFGVVARMRREGVTVLLVEQNVHRALALSDRAYILEVGRVTLHGSGHELLNDDHVRRAYLGI